MVSIGLHNHVDVILVSINTSLYLSDVHICTVYQVFLGLLPLGVLTIPLLEIFPYSAIGDLYRRCFFHCSVILIISPVNATTTTPPVTVVFSRASPITITVTMALTSMGLATSGQHDVVLPPQLILRDALRGSVGLVTVLMQKQS